MPGVLRRTFALIVTALVILTTLPVTQASAGSRLDETRAKIRATRSRLASAMRSDAEILGALRVITAQLGEQRSTLAAARAHLARIDLAIKGEERRLVVLATERKRRQAVVAARARALYMSGPMDADSALTGNDSLEDYLGRAASLDFVADYDQRMLEDLASIRDRARKTQEALASQRKLAVERRDEISQRVGFVNELADAKQEAHDNLSSSISQYRNSLAALQREQARILRIINSRGSQGTISGTPGRLGFAWPTSSRRINSPYGPRWGGFHTGMDIQCSQGVRFAAARSGKVIQAGYAGGYGNMTIVDHGGGYSTLYAHQSSIGVRRGQSVSRGQVIGRCGSTGNSSGSHMHFEVRFNGNHRNPRPYLP